MKQVTRHRFPMLYQSLQRVNYIWQPGFLLAAFMTCVMQLTYQRSPRSISNSLPTGLYIETRRPAVAASHWAARYRKSAVWRESHPRLLNLASPPFCAIFPFAGGPDGRGPRGQTGGQAFKWLPMVPRKVRTPQGRTPGNTRGPQGYGKCNREQTAQVRHTGPASRRRTGKGETVG
jgi:hypothetical protein